MPVAIELLFDKKSENVIRDIWKALYDEGVCRWLYESASIPHITLGVYNDGFGNISEMINEVENFSIEMRQMNLQMSNIGLFNVDGSVIFISPKVTEELLEVHRKFHQQMNKYIKYSWEYYLHNLWIPHCAIAMNIDENLKLKCIDIVSKKFKPFFVSIEKIGIVKFKPIETISTFILK